MAFKRIVSSLQDKASAQLAINLCQENSFKEVALCLERSTSAVFVKSYLPSSRGKVEQWDAAVDKQCQKLTEGLPYFLKHRVHAWINRIALEYLCYCRRHEVLFGISRHFLMDILTQDDWTEMSRLDEKKLAKRLIKDERLTVLQRYRIACIYCLEVSIFELWERLTHKEQQLFRTNANTHLPEYTNSMFFIWSNYIKILQDKNETLSNSQLWMIMTEEAVCNGIQTSVTSCWKELEDQTRQKVVLKMALTSLEKWQSTQNVCNYWRERLVSNELPRVRLDSVEEFNLPSYYSNLVCFFLLEMNKEQQLTFFKSAFESRHCDFILECFLEWPHQDNFLPVINQLWEIVPKDKYGRCLLSLASKYTENYDWKLFRTPLYRKENCYYDYRSLLWSLWEDTPNEFKRYVFFKKKPNSVEYRKAMINEGEALLPQLLDKSPFQMKDEALFKRILHDVQQEERIVIMHSESGGNICCMLIKRKRWSFLNWFLEKCLPKEGISKFKKQFIQSKVAHQLYFSKKKDDCLKSLEELIDWAFELDTEKVQFKSTLADVEECSDSCTSLLIKGKFTQVERIIDFCLLVDEKKNDFKESIAKDTCLSLVESSLSISEQIDKVIAWGFDNEEEKRSFKRLLFYFKGIDMHYKLVFKEKHWEGVKQFYEWFCLTPEQIKNIKRETIFKPNIFQFIIKELFHNTDILVSLRWCLIDEEQVIRFKKKVEEECFKHTLNVKDKNMKEHFDYLVNELLSDFRREEVKDKTRGDEDFVKDKGDKRSSVVIDDDFYLPNKRFK